MLYKYLFLWQYGQPSTSETGGLFFPLAIQHLFVGMYVQQVCLAALFFLARNQNRNPSAIPQGALMVVLIVLTAGFHIIINNSYGPLLKSLPLSIKDRVVDDEPAPESVRLTDDKHISVLEDASEKKDDGGIATSSVPGPRPTDPEDYGFAHPAVSRPQRTIWIPKDTLGLAEEEQRGCMDASVDASYSHASMNEQGKVDISGGPPDEVEEE
ncbi:hypothetical protein H0H93_010294 [Arthromyces matolae]|nr:hypothetical protein H0H93_010294 [Arthromyces matolae]